MNTIHLTPNELDAIVESNVAGFIQVVDKHLPCICKKKMHMHCPRHQFHAVATAMFASRKSIGDKVLHEQQVADEKKIIIVQS